MVIAPDERGWRIRDRADWRERRIGMSFVPFVFVGGGTALLWPVIPAVTGLLVAAAVIVVLTAVVLAVFKQSGESVVDVGAHHITLPDGTVVPFRTVGGVSFDTTMEISGRRQLSRRQVWCLRLLDGHRRAVYTVAWHTKEYALYAAAMKLSEELRVPLLDTCGGSDKVALFEPGDRFDDGTLAVPDGQPPRDAGRLEAGPTGPGLWWRSRRGSSIVALVVFAGVTTAAIWYAVAAENLAQGIARGVGAWFAFILLVASARGAQCHGRTTLTVSNDELRLRLPFPFPHGPTLPWRSVQRLRLTQFLNPATTRSGDPPRAPRILFLDVLVRGRRRVRVALATEQARWVYDQIRLTAPRS